VDRKVLYTFPARHLDGVEPLGDLLINQEGSIFGTTFLGGANDPHAGGLGTVFSLKSSGSPEHILYSFAGNPDGELPAVGLLGFNNALYGTTEYGGVNGLGTVFQLTPPTATGSPWNETVLHSFGTYTATQSAPLVSDANGVLYGTTPGSGTLFSLSPPGAAGGSWTFTTIYTFPADGSLGSGPLNKLIVGPSGVLYGTTQNGGTTDLGVVFSLTPPAVAGGQWTEAVLHMFTGGVEGPDGGGPVAGMTLVGGVLYGTTSAGGSAGVNCGTVFAIMP